MQLISSPTTFIIWSGSLCSWNVLVNSLKNNLLIVLCTWNGATSCRDRKVSTPPTFRSRLLKKVLVLCKWKHILTLSFPDISRILLCTLAMDPLARSLQQRHLHRGLSFRSGKLVLLNLCIWYSAFDRHSVINVSPLIREIFRFGRHSGIIINWEKNGICPLTDNAIPDPLDNPARWVMDRVKYLGIIQHREVESIIHLNYGPAIDTSHHQLDTWVKLPISLAGRVAWLKMVALPIFLC